MGVISTNKNNWRYYIYIWYYNCIIYIYIIIIIYNWMVVYDTYINSQRSYYATLM